jgi:hypothetical protein
LRILVLYNLLQHPLRSTISDHLYSLRRYSSGRVFYVNLAVRDLPDWVAGFPFDAVVFHTSFLGQRWDPAGFDAQLERVQALKEASGVRIALPQDEFLGADQLCEFIEDFRVDHVFSVAPESEWPKIYEGVDRERTSISQVLTGYLAEDTVRRIDEIVTRAPERSVDVGYRAWEGAPWLGRHGMLKRRIGEVFAQAAPAAGLRADISMDESGVLAGDDWFRFLADCRYTVGVEGGATILDRDGELRRRTEDYLREHPGASFDEVEAACFPGEDGRLRLLAISPRHLEACATRTCQVLVEGDYNGILRAGEHYIELRSDLSNVDGVISQMADEDQRRRLTDNAYRDVVASGSHGYASFVREVEAVVPEREGRASLAVALRHRASELADHRSWAAVRRRLADLPPRGRRLRDGARRLFIDLPARAVVSVLPDRAVTAIRRRRGTDSFPTPDSK